jgi:MFS family permease
MLLIGSFSHDTLHTSQSTSISLLLTMNGVGLPGRLIPNYLADRVTGPLNLIAIFAGVCSVIMYCWIAVDSVTGVWAFAVVYGSCAAGVQSLFPATVASLTTDPKKAGVRMGMVFSVAGFATLTGPPIAGALIQLGKGRYLYAQIFAATAMGAGCAMVGAARWAKVGWTVRAKV